MVRVLEGYNPPSTVGKGRFDVHSKVAAGSFGEVYRGIDTRGNAEVAIKIEHASSDTPVLRNEAEILEHLTNPYTPQGITEYYWYGKEGQYNCFVMQLLGPSLDDVMKACSGRLSLKSTVLVAEQALHVMEYVHSKSVVYCDVKPENFLMGLNGKAHHVYLVDFGLSKRYHDGRRHISQKSKKGSGVSGTAKFNSLNANRGLDQSRRDDLESLGHLLIYLLKGALPWSSVEWKTKQERNRKILESMEKTSLEELCSGYPEELVLFVRYCRSLRFKERPDYCLLDRLITAVREKIGPVEDHDLQWLETPDLSDLELSPKATLKRSASRSLQRSASRGNLARSGSQKLGRSLSRNLSCLSQIVIPEPLEPWISLSQPDDAVSESDGFVGTLRRSLFASRRTQDTSSARDCSPKLTVPARSSLQSCSMAAPSNREFDCDDSLPVSSSPSTGSGSSRGTGKGKEERRAHRLGFQRLEGVYSSSEKDAQSGSEGSHASPEAKGARETERASSVDGPPHPAEDKPAREDPVSVKDDLALIKLRRKKVADEIAVPSGAVPRSRSPAPALSSRGACLLTNVSSTSDAPVLAPMLDPDQANCQKDPAPTVSGSRGRGGSNASENLSDSWATEAVQANLPRRVSRQRSMGCRLLRLSMSSDCPWLDPPPPRNPADVIIEF